jgi:diguanylate cyclase (GGDEF)-like protein
MNALARKFRRQFLFYIAMAWMIPPVFGLVFLLFFEIFTAQQVGIIMTTPWQPLYALITLSLALWFFNRYARPLVRFLNADKSIGRKTVLERLRRFPLVFWLTFLGYLLISPGVTIIGAEIYTDFVAGPMDWFRVHMVALIVSIIVGLPIFLMIFDLFGRELGHIELHRPIFTIKTKVFLIGALIPLLIDTMLVQYYWTRTGYFTSETFVIWLLLEVLAIVGSLLFMHSLGQSLSPMQVLIDRSRLLEEIPIEGLVAASQDELGKLTQDIRQLLEEQRVHGARGDLNNHLLSVMHDSASLESLLKTAVDTSCKWLRSDICFLALHDEERQELTGVVYTGSEYRAEGHFHLSLDEPSVFAEVFREGKVKTIFDTRHDPRASRKLVERFRFRSIAAAPLYHGNRNIGVMAAAFNSQKSEFSYSQLNGLKAFAQEAALIESFIRDQNERSRVEEAITKITQGVSTAIGEEFFMAVADIMAEILVADVVGIGVLDADDPDFIDTLGFNLNHKKIPNMRYNVKGTPCDKVLEGGVRIYEDGLQELFPDDKEVREWGMNSYVGVPLYDAHQKPLGLQFAMFRQPPKNLEFTESVMRIFAARTAGEIERMHNEERIKFMAYYDGLTGLPNRELFLDRLNLALAHADRTQHTVAVMLLDLDHFKAINDSLGHPVGDKLLTEVGKRLQGMLRHEDTVARLGGDEFVILLSHAGTREQALQHTTQVADKLREELARPFLVEGHNLIVSPSTGIALYPMDGENPDQLVKNADIALYQAKGNGRDNYQFFSADMNNAAMERLELEAALRRALELEQFELVFQPKVSCKDCSIVGAEALLRWNHPEWGVVTPDRFIPVAEETGMIIPIGQWVMEEACRSIAEMGCTRDECSCYLTIAFNVSPRQFSQTDFVAQIKSALEVSDIMPRCLEIELTENVLIHDIQEVEQKLHDLKAMGIRISIDDFGTGYSSLRYLQRLPIDTIKIDRDFIKNIVTNPSDAVIVETILAMAEHLEMNTIAEGVETRGQMEILNSYGCQGYQGYLFGSPVSLEEYRAMLEQSTASRAGCSVLGQCVVRE